MGRVLRAVLALITAVALLGGCSAEGNVDTSGDGVRIEGDVDSNTP